MLQSGFSYPRNEETRPNQIKAKCNQQHLQGIKHEVVYTRQIYCGRRRLCWINELIRGWLGWWYGIIWTLYKNLWQQSSSSYVKGHSSHLDFIWLFFGPSWPDISTLISPKSICQLYLRLRVSLSAVVSSSVSSQKQNPSLIPHLTEIRYDFSINETR